MSLPMPWGQALVHPMEPRQLLGLPLAFTQYALLTPEEFAKPCTRYPSIRDARYVPMTLGCGDLSLTGCSARVCRGLLGIDQDLGGGCFTLQLSECCSSDLGRLRRGERSLPNPWPAGTQQGFSACEGDEQVWRLSRVPLNFGGGPR
jgi:hypothetical protein